VMKRRKKKKMKMKKKKMKMKKIMKMNYMMIPRKRRVLSILSTGSVNTLKNIIIYNLKSLIRVHGSNQHNEIFKCGDGTELQNLLLSNAEPMQLDIKTFSLDILDVQGFFPLPFLNDQKEEVVGQQTTQEFSNRQHSLLHGFQILQPSSAI
jgi:hypothetical protein